MGLLGGSGAKDCGGPWVSGGGDRWVLVGFKGWRSVRSCGFLMVEISWVSGFLDWCVEVVGCGWTLIISVPLPPWFCSWSPFFICFAPRLATAKPQWTTTATSDSGGLRLWFIHFLLLLLLFSSWVWGFRFGC